MRKEIYTQSASLHASVVARPKKPSITGVTRLETQPTTVGLQAGLQAPVADPLWLLARQWQFNEFEGEDAGTPIDLSFAIDGTRVDAFRPGASPDTAWQPLNDGGPPIETRVEAEAVWRTHPRLRAEAGQHALRMAAKPLRDALLLAFPLTLQAPTDADSDRAGARWAALLGSGRSVDGAALAAALQPLRDADGALTSLPPTLPLAGADADAARAVLTRWLRWLDAFVVEGDGASWQRNRLEYAFALRAGATQLEADEYTDGRVDWDDFVARGGEQAEPPNPIKQAFAVASRLPAPVTYPGMPAERYWEFEDGNVNFAGAEAGVTDVLRLCVTEFALTYGNDWFLVPVRLPVGWLHRVSRFDVRDSFGVASSPQPMRNPDGSQWTLYALAAERGSRVAHTLFLPDTLDGVQEGTVLEHTLLARDEMANVAWAIERTVQGAAGEPLNRTQEAQALAFQQRIDFSGAAAADATLVYRLQTPVPSNWTPLLPVRDPLLNLADPLSIRLARAGFKRFYPQAGVDVIGEDSPEYAAFLAHLRGQPNFIDVDELDANLVAATFHPRGWLLRSDPTVPLAGDPLLLEEEEVPRIGATLKRKFQYARSSDGRSWLWIGRSKTAGRGEARGELRYDVAVKRQTLR